MAIHMRLKNRPDPGACEHCGASKVTLHWALDHDRCLTPLESEQGPYSLDPSDYRRLCVPCHKTMDLEQLAA
jgi:hypothetical protein